MEGDEDDLRTQVFRLTDALKRVEDVADAQITEAVLERDRARDEVKALRRQLREAKNANSELQASLDGMEAEREALMLSRPQMDLLIPNLADYEECGNCRLRRAEADVARQEAEDAEAMTRQLKQKLSTYHRQLARADEELAALKHSVSMADAALRASTARCSQLQVDVDEQAQELARQRRLNGNLAAASRKANAAATAANVVAAAAAAAAAAGSQQQDRRDSVTLDGSPTLGRGSAQGSRRNSGVADTLREMHEAEVRASLERRAATAEGRASAVEAELDRVRVRAVREAHQLRVENSELCEELMALRRTSAGHRGPSSTGTSPISRRLSINSLRTQSWLTQLQASGVRADDLTHSTIILSALRDGSTDDAVAHLTKMQSDGVQLTPYLYERVLTALCKDGRINSAERVYDLMQTAGIQPGSTQFRQLVRGSLVAEDSDRAQHWLRMAADSGVDAGIVAAALLSDYTLPSQCRSDLEQLQLPSRVGTPVDSSSRTPRGRSADDSLRNGSFFGGGIFLGSGGSLPSSRPGSADNTPRGSALLLPEFLGERQSEGTGLRLPRTLADSTAARGPTAPSPHSLTRLNFEALSTLKEVGDPISNQHRPGQALLERDEENGAPFEDQLSGSSLPERPASSTSRRSSRRSDTLRTVSEEEILQALKEQSGGGLTASSGLSENGDFEAGLDVNRDGNSSSPRRMSLFSEV